MKPSSKRGFKQLEDRWYRKLEKKGFVDIEDTKNPERPLKAWHSRRFGEFRDRNSPVQRRGRTEFFQAASRLLTHVKRFKTKHSRKIWRLFCEGLSEREIAAKTNIPKSTVHWVIALISKEIKWK